MRLAIFKIMLLSLLRDRAALAMSFILPGVVFAIFAVIFSGTSGGELAIRVAVADLRNDAGSEKVLQELFKSPTLKQSGAADAEREDVVKAVRDGGADVGLVVLPDSGPLDRPAAEGRKHFEIVTDPSKEIANTMLEGTLQQAYTTLLPRPPGSDRVMARSPVVDNEGAFSAVSYYAGAVAMMFLLFFSLTSSLSYLDERESGILERIAVGPGGVGVVIDGKFVFLMAMGVLQVFVVFAVAWLAFGLELPGKIIGWATVTFASAVAASGLVLAFVTVCRTKKQAETLGQMLVLVISAIGGSMVPRFLMPAEVQWLGWLTPNTWALEAYASVFWRGDPMAALILPCMVLIGSGMLGLLFAHLMSRRGMRVRG